MPRTCTLCSHPERPEIDRALVGGASNRSIALHLGVSHMAVQRHRAHLSARLVRAREAKAEREARSLLDQMDEHLARAKDVLDRVVPKQGRIRAFEAAAALREVRETLMSIGKLTGELRSDTRVQVNIIQSPEWLALQERLLAVLRRFPDARAAVIEELGADAAGRE